MSDVNIQLSQDVCITWNTKGSVFSSSIVS